MRQRGAQVDTKQNLQQFRPSSRVPSSNRQVPHSKPRHHAHTSAPNPTSKPGPSQSLKKSGPSRIYVDSTRGSVPDYEHSTALDAVRTTIYICLGQLHEVLVPIRPDS